MIGTYTMRKVLQITLLIIPLACSFVIAQPSRASSYVEKGREAYEKGDVQTALREFEEALEYDKTQPNIYTYLGNIYFIMGEYDQAESFFTRALEQYWKNARSNPQGTYREGDIIILDPKENSATTEAMLYNNRGAARYRLGDINDAMLDFEEALGLQPGLEVAQINQETAVDGTGGIVSTGIPGRYQSPNSRTRQPISSSSRRNPTSSKGKTTINPRFRKDTRHPRPKNVAAPFDLNAQRQASENIRETRLEIIDMAENGESRGLPFDLFSRKPFVKRKVPARGKIYRKPAIKGSSQDYISIEEVKITTKETRIRIRVENPDSRSYRLSLNKPNSEGAYYINDRSGSSRSKVRLRKIEGIEQYPNSSELKPFSTIEFTLVFGKIPDTMGFINILEGRTEDGSEWNFYGVDLRR
ncbi:MAG: tetratricopeptide repeat protein [Bacteroidota bacterium]